MIKILAVHLFIIKSNYIALRDRSVVLITRLFVNITDINIYRKALLSIHRKIKNDR